MSELKEAIREAWGGTLMPFEAPIDWNPTLPENDVEKFQVWWEAEFGDSIDLITQKDGVTTHYISDDFGEHWKSGSVIPADEADEMWSEE